jgi:hypothetical protein
MTKLRLVASVSCLLSAAVFYTACSDSDSSTPPGAAGASNHETAGGEANGGEPNAAGATANNGGAAAGRGPTASAAGQDNEGGNPPVTSDGGASPGAGGGSNEVPTLPTGPCTYATSGGADLPPADAQFICTAISRLYQDNGEGDYEALFGGGFYVDGTDVSSTMACDLSSATAPAAGDSWVLGPDHPGNCQLSSQVDGVGSLWSANNSPARGAVTITFGSVTMTNGTSDPSDVYYLSTIKLSGTLVSETGGDDIELSGSFDVKVPIGG